MFKIPDNLVTQVKVAEEFVIAKVGNGVASLCGNKIIIEVPSKDVSLGDRFYATANNRLVKRLTLDSVVTPTKHTQLIYKGRQY